MHSHDLKIEQFSEKNQAALADMADKWSDLLVAVLTTGTDCRVRINFEVKNGLIQRPFRMGVERSH